MAGAGTLCIVSEVALADDPQRLQAVATEIG
jgi:hypothetical protein